MQKKNLTIKELVQLVRSEISTPIKYCRKNNTLYFYNQEKLQSLLKYEDFLKKLTETYEISNPKITPDVISFKILPSFLYKSEKWYGKHPKMEGLGATGWWTKKVKTEVVRKRLSTPILVSMNNRLVELKEKMLIIPSELALDGFVYEVQSISKSFVKLLSADTGTINLPHSYFRTNLTMALK